MSSSLSNSRLLIYLSGWPRRLAAVGCLVAAALSFVTATHRRPGAVPVVVTARGLAAGVTLDAGDLRLMHWPDGLPPPAAARSPDQLVGRRTAAALAAGMPIGLDSLLEPAVARALATGRVATTVRLADPAELAVVRAGSYVDLYADNGNSADLIEGKPIAGNAGSATRASAVLVLSVLAGNNAGGGNTNPTLVIAVDRATAAKLSTHASATFVATLVEPP